MEGAVGERYWCHMCSQTVNPVREVALQCPFCLSGFVEEMDSPSRRLDESELASESALALWAPILLGMMNNTTSHSRPGRRPHILDENGGDEENESRELDAAAVRRRRRSSAAVLQLLQGITSEISGESENSENGRGSREPFILINPFNQTILVQDSEDSSHDRNSDRNPFGSLGDYFIGPGLDLLLQHIAENDPNRYGTAPAKKDAVDALSTVKVGDNLQCPVCLDEFEIQSEAKEMPCKHKFHSGCLLPWLELHSSCPVCRYQLPADESKCDAEITNGSHENHHSVEEQGGGGSSLSLPWPLNAFSSSSRQRGNSTGSSSGGHGATASQADGN